MTVRGDAQLGIVRVELLAGELGSPAAAVPQTILRLSTSGLGNDPRGQKDAASLLSNNLPRWLDEQRVAFFWHDAGEVRQVVACNVLTRSIEFLTHHPTDVDRFEVGPHGELLYWAAVPVQEGRSARALQQGYDVSSNDAFALLSGLAGIDGVIQPFKREWYLSVPGSHRPQPVRSASADGASFIGAWSPVGFSPDGHLAIVSARPVRVPAQWGGYTSAFLRRSLQERAVDSNSRAAFMLQQYFVVDTKSAAARPLWDAPLDAYRIATYLDWAPDGRSIVLGPTHLPISYPSKDGLSGEAIAEVQVPSGNFLPLPVDGELVRAMEGLKWLSNDAVEVSLRGERVVRFHKRARRWQLAVSDAASTALRSSRRPVPVRLEQREELNARPAIYAVERYSPKERLAFDSNPQLQTRFALAHVQIIRWVDIAGREWAGRLYNPTNVPCGNRCPLVIQTNAEFGVGEHTFSLYGATNSTLGPAFTAWIAQPLANKGIAVLQGGVPIKALPRDNAARLNGILPYIAAYAAAAEHLAAGGLVDRSRVGLMGYSNRAWHVQYALAFSDFPYAAAIATDGIDGGYLGAAFTGWDAGLGQSLMGAQPFGAGLQAWLKNSPPLNADRIKTPLMLQVTDSQGGIAAPLLHGWESFSRLRHLGKPVELYVTPDIERGSHALQNPRQLLAVQRRALDWWLFWLKGAAEPDPALVSRYEAWRVMQR